jgi:hypothetical protein
MIGFTEKVDSQESSKTKPEAIFSGVNEQIAGTIDAALGGHNPIGKHQKMIA